MKSFKYHIIVPLFLWMLIVGGTYVADHQKIDACSDRGQVVDYSSFRCVSRDLAPETSYFKARYSRFAGVSIAVLLYVGAITTFFIVKELRKHN